MKKLLIIILFAILFTGCSNKEKDPEAAGKNDTISDNNEDTEEETTAQAAELGYQFKYNEVIVDMNVDATPVVEALGEPQDYFEAESCAFKGLDKFYYYSGIELTTYPMNNKDYISSITFSDDSVSTIEGIYLGSSLDDVIKAYGDNYTEESGLYTFEKGQSKLTFLVENDAVAAITYLAIVEGQE